MIIVILLIFLLLSITSPSGEIRAVGERYVSRIFVKTSTIRDVEYKPGQKLDIVVPSGDEERKRMAVILVHGGSFIGGDKGALLDDAVSLAKMGYVAMTINYRLGLKSQRVTWANIESTSSQSVIKMAREDIEAAIAWLKTKSTSYGVDPDRVVLLGSSAGAVASLYVGHLPLSSISRPMAVISLMGAIPPRDLLALDKKGPATIFFHGSADKTVPQFAAETTVDKMKSLGTEVGWHSFPNLGHTVDWSNSVVEGEGVSFLKKVMDGEATRPTVNQTVVPTSKLTPRPAVGDANFDGIADAQDLAIWLEEFSDGDYGGIEKNGWRADFGGLGGVSDGRVDVYDYAVWYKMAVETPVR